MTLEEAFETLGLDPSCSRRELRRAYHQLIKRHKPDRDPVKFRRVRDAYELAKLVLEARDEDAVPSSFPESPVVSEALAQLPPEPVFEDDDPLLDVDPSVVLDALEDGNVARALALVMDERWAKALHSDFTGALVHTTYRVACAVVLTDLGAFAQLEVRYGDVIALSRGDTLVHLRIVADDWAWAKENCDVPTVLRDFVSFVSVATTPQRHALGHALGQWFVRDPRAGLRVLRGLHEARPLVAGFLQSTLDELDAEISSWPAFPLVEDTPATALRRFAWGSSAVALLVGVGVGVVVGLASGVATLGGWLGACVMWLLNNSVRFVFRANTGLQARFVLACLGADEEPVLAAASVPINEALRAEISKDPVLALAYGVGRFVRFDASS